MIVIKGMFFLQPVNSFFRFGLVFLLSLMFMRSVAQGHKTDSLKSLLATSSGSNRGQILFELAYRFTDNDNKVAMTYVDRATALSTTLGDSLLMVKCGRLKSLLHRRFDQMDSSLTLSEKILPIAERNGYRDEIKKILNGLALVYSYKAMYDKALNSYLRILEATDPEKNKKDFSTALNNVGLVYFKLDDLKTALYYFNRALALTGESSDNPLVQTTLLNIGLCYAYQGDYPLAKDFTERAIRKFKGECPADLKGSAHFTFGLIAHGLKQFDEAEKHFFTSYELMKQQGNDVYELDNLIYLFRIYMETGNSAGAKKLIGEAERILSSNTYYTQGIMELYEQLAKVYQQQGNIAKVAQYQSRYIQLRDSVYDEQLTTNLMRVESEYLERENKAKLDVQAKILELSEDIIKRQRTINIVVCIVAVLSIAIVVVLTQNVKQKRLANLLLEQKVKQRTTELEANHLNLLKSLEERNQQVKRITSEIKSSMATIKGLCQLSQQDGSVVNTGQYITKIERATDTLQSGIYRTLGVSEASV